MKRNKQTLSVWKVKASKFPSKGKIEQQIKYLLRYAILAPSGHNSQPWKFIIEGKKLKVLADMEQARAEVDPENRELFISVGCAIANIEIAAKHFKLQWKEKWWPKKEEPNLVLEIEFSQNRKVYPDVSPLFEAITRRSTYRGEFEAGKDVDRETLKNGDRQLRSKIAKLRWIERKEEKEKVGALVESAQKVWFRSRKLTEELVFWLRRDIDQIEKKAKSGVIMLNNFNKRLAQFAGDEFKEVDQRAERDKEWLLKSPVVGVLMTENDGGKNWVETGRKYQYLALWATSLGMQMGFFNSVVELPRKRAQLALALDETKWPQLLFRIGYGKRGPPSPRKTVREVIISTH